MPAKHRAFRQPACACGGDVIRLQFHQHARPQVTHQHRRQRQGDGQARQEHVVRLVQPGAPVTGHREQAPFHAEQQDQHQPQPERRHAQADRGEHADQLVRPTALLARRNRCQWHRYQQSEHHAAQHQHQRRLDPGDDQFQGVDLVQQRLAEVALEQVFQEVKVLQPQGLVEAELGADLQQRIRRAARTQQGTRRVARNRAHQHEGDQADAQQHRQQLQGPGQHKTVARQVHASASVASEKVQQHREVRLRLLVKRHMTAVGEHMQLGVGCC